MKNNNNNKTKAFVFDFDDTLASTNAKVLVRKYRVPSQVLTPAEYSTYELADGESFDFSEFKNPEFIINASLCDNPCQEKIDSLHNKVFQLSLI